MAKYSIGDPVLRIEDRPERRATIDAIEDRGREPLYHLVYAEGGDGWWPESAVEPADPSGA